MEADAFRNSLRKALGICAVVLAVALPAKALYHFSAQNMDEAFNYVYPTLILRGIYPARDFLTLYGAGHFFLLSALFKTFGISLSVERSWALLLHVFIACSLYVMTLRAGMVIACLCGLLSAISLTGLGLVAYPWLTAIAFVLLSVLTIRFKGPEFSQRGCWAAGILTGLASSFRVEMAAIGAICQLPMIVRRKALTAFGPALLIGVLPMILYGTTMRPPSNAHGWMSQAIAPRLMAMISQRWIDVETSTFAIVLAASLFNIVAAVWLAGRKERADSDELLMLGLLCILILPQFLQWPEWSHALQVGCISVSLVPYFSARLLQSVFKMARLHILCIATVLSICLVTAQNSVFRFVGGATAIALGLRKSDSCIVEHRGRELVLAPSECLSVKKVIAIVDSMIAPSSKIFIGPQDFGSMVQSRTFLYFLLPEFKPASYFLQFDPLTERSAVVASLQRELANTDALILFGEEQPSRSGSSLFDLCPAAARDFEFYATAGDYHVYRKRRTEIR